MRTPLHFCSNNTNKLSPQEQGSLQSAEHDVQIIQINLVLKNQDIGGVILTMVQIIQINLVLKNTEHGETKTAEFK